MALEKKENIGLEQKGDYGMLNIGIFYFLMHTLRVRISLFRRNPSPPRPSPNCYQLPTNASSHACFLAIQNTTGYAMLYSTLDLIHHHHHYPPHLHPSQ